jgi:hypothetical protein
MAAVEKISYALTKIELQRINKIAHKRSQCKEGFLKQRTRLRVLFSILLSEGFPFEQIEEATKNNQNKLQEELVKLKNHLITL